MIKKKYILIGLIIATVYAITIGFGVNWQDSVAIITYLEICLLLYVPVISAIILNIIFKILNIKNQIFINIVKILFYTVSILYILFFGIITGFYIDLDSQDLSLK